MQIAVLPYQEIKFPDKAMPVKFEHSLPHCAKNMKHVFKPDRTFVHTTGSLVIFAEIKFGYLCNVHQTSSTLL